MLFKIFLVKILFSKISLLKSWYFITGSSFPNHPSYGGMCDPVIQQVTR